MNRDYPLVTPSLEGVLSHESLSYEGIRRPIEVLRALDGPGRASGRSAGHKQPHHEKLLERYFYDLYGVFMKKLSAFALAPAVPEADAVGLQAMLQEMIKVKKLLG